MKETLKDRLLNGKAIGETFSCCGTSFTYTVIGLHTGEDRPTDYVCLIARDPKKENFKEGHYNLADRLEDIHMPQEQLQKPKQQTPSKSPSPYKPKLTPPPKKPRIRDPSASSYDASGRKP